MSNPATIDISTSGMQHKPSQSLSLIRTADIRN